jgi:hypothetical protein
VCAALLLMAHNTYTCCLHRWHRCCCRCFHCSQLLMLLMEMLPLHLLAAAAAAHRPVCLLFAVEAEGGVTAAAHHIQRLIRRTVNAALHRILTVDACNSNDSSRAAKV